MRAVTDMDIVRAVAMRERIQEVLGDAMTEFRDFYPEDDQPGMPGTLGNSVWRMAERITEAYETASEVIGQMQMLRAGGNRDGA